MQRDQDAENSWRIFIGSALVAIALFGVYVRADANQKKLDLLLRNAAADGAASAAQIPFDAGREVWTGALIVGWAVAAPGWWRLGRDAWRAAR